MIEIIDGTWAAGETKTFHINGEYLELLDAQYSCDVYLMDKSGSQLSVMRKCEVSFFSKPTGGFNSVQITSTQAQYIRFFVGSGDAGTRRISSSVSIVDGGKARTIAGAAFMDVFGPNSVANQFSYAQIWNPAGSGKRVIVSQVSGTSQAGGYLTLAFSAGMLPTLLRKAGSKISGGAASVVDCRVATDQTDYVPGSVARIYSYYIQANGNVVYKLNEPIVINPGAGLIGKSALGSDINAGFEFFEESI